MAAHLITARLHSITYAAQGTRLYELRDPGGGDLPPFTAGAHVDVHLGNGLVRQYSLVNAPGERSRYVLGIKRDPRSRGGSEWIDRQWRVGDAVRVSLPRNHFPLHDGQAPAILIAGGIGVTPLLCMARSLQQSGRDWQLHYGVRTRADAMDLSYLEQARVHLHVDHEHEGQPMSVRDIVARAAADSHLYCCGPEPMLDVFEAITAARPRACVHVERFSTARPIASSGGFFLELARSGMTVCVGPGERIVDALRRAGVNVETSCEQGVCGSCETRVLGGLPDHRDMLLSEEERAANRAIMVCCSGSLSDLLVLDL